jgi:hypothetical protein
MLSVTTGRLSAEIRSNHIRRNSPQGIGSVQRLGVQAARAVSEQGWASASKS